MGCNIWQLWSGITWPRYGHWGVKHGSKSYVGAITIEPIKTPPAKIQFLNYGVLSNKIFHQKTCFLHEMAKTPNKLQKCPDKVQFQNYMFLWKNSLTSGTHFPRQHKLIKKVGCMVLASYTSNKTLFICPNSEIY